MKKAYTFLITLGILAIAGVSAFSVWSATKPNNLERFSVTGSGTVYAKADIANLSVGFKTTVKKTAAEATKENADKMNEIISAVKTLGVEAKDIKTTNYSLRPVYNWTEKEGQQLVGYEVSQNADIKIRDLDKIGDIIAQTTAKGANQVGDISFTIDDEYQLKNEARELAITKAKEKAEIIAKQTGMKLGKIKGVYESSVTPMPVYDYTNARKEMLSADAGNVSAPAIESGQNEIKVEVTLNYEIK
jgi:uncharacterized protein YggE